VNCICGHTVDKHRDALRECRAPDCLCGKLILESEPMICICTHTKGCHLDAFSECQKCHCKSFRPYELKADVVPQEVIRSQEAARTRLQAEHALVERGVAFDYPALREKLEALIVKECPLITPQNVDQDISITLTVWEWGALVGMLTVIGQEPPD